MGWIKLRFHLLVWSPLCRRGEVDGNHRRFADQDNFAAYFLLVISNPLIEFRFKRTQARGRRSEKFGPGAPAGGAGAALGSGPCGGMS